MKKYYVVYYYTSKNDDTNLGISNATILSSYKIKNIDEIAKIESSIAMKMDYSKVKLINWKKLSSWLNIFTQCIIKKKINI